VGGLGKYVTCHISESGADPEILKGGGGLLSLLPFPSPPSFPFAFPLTPPFPSPPLLFLSLPFPPLLALPSPSRAPPLSPRLEVGPLKSS